MQLDKYKPGTDEFQLINEQIDRIMDGLDGTAWNHCFDILTNCMERLLTQMEDSDAREYVLQCLNRFVLIQLMGPEVYKETMDEAAEAVQTLQADGIIPPPESPTKH